MFNANIPNTGHGHHGRDRPIVIDDEDDDDNNGGMQVDYPQHPHMAYGHNASAGPDRMPSPGYPAWHRHTALEQEKKVRSRLREERHAALCVLLDRELLTLQALANQETLPQARRRFLSKLLAPGDADEEARIRADRFIIQHPSATSSSSSSAAPMTVSRGIVDVHETDDGGWRRPDAGSGSGSAVSSPASSVKKKGKETPERARSKAKGSASRQQPRERERERERRRRSGAEREDPGSPSLQRFSP
ncbi:hypothetical protein CNMCM5793_009163 [Aspergillus hiratsukae]|uniref:Uncharacterized protein n=1 Tax=Aspergillus hiratsukae TaxID=1194566 RepID=A0A8H6P8B1_9EURO|nr:hypothetical protein CNMCM5793_009163 [Aspergillus hiratsukae]KAF7160128.1 hypothetical protein CNMCM6106_007588 [Aspergillus hiratsukae]